MQVTSRDFQRDFARMPRRAKSGEVIYVTLGAEEFVVAKRVAKLERSRFPKNPANQLIFASALVHKLRLIPDDSRIRLWERSPSSAGSSTGPVPIPSSSVRQEPQQMTITRGSTESGSPAISFKNLCLSALR